MIKEDCTVMGAPILLRSAIENVVRNAARYTQDGTCASITLERSQDDHRPEAIIRIIDSGPGVPEEALDKLFRPFYRIDDARGRQTGGVGLGLAITERAVRLHGGTVKASNRPEGGLQVEIRLPLGPWLCASRIRMVSRKGPNRWRPVLTAHIETFIPERFAQAMGQLSSSIVVPISQRGLLFRVIPDTQMRVLLDLDRPA